MFVERMHSTDSDLAGVIVAFLMTIHAGRAFDVVIPNITTEGNTLKAQEEFWEGNETSTQYSKRHELVQVLFQGTV